jgi:hypothetical protein
MAGKKPTVDKPAGKDAGMVLDCEAVARGTLAQRRQRHRFKTKTMIKICPYSALTPL